MAPPIIEDTLTTEDDRLYFTLDPTVTITGDVTAVPTGWTELDDNSDWSARGRAVTGDGQKRKHRGHAHPVQTNAEDEITFNIKPSADVDPAVDLQIDRGTLMKLLMVKTDGSYRMDEVIVTEVTERSQLAALPEWSGTAQGRAHPVRGKINTWPPAPPGP